MTDSAVISDLDPLTDGLDYPMFVVTTAHDGQRSGCLVGFATQVSINPPRLLVCLSVNNHTYRVARHASTMAVHTLDRHQLKLAALFGSTTDDEIDKFARCAWEPGPDGVPLLTDSSRWVVGRIIERFPFGDHVGHLLEPTEAGRRDNSAVLTFQQVRRLPPGHPA